MTQEQFNTDSRKGKHLSYQEWCQIANLKKEACSNRAIARLFGVPRKPFIMKSKEELSRILNAKNKTVNAMIIPVNSQAIKHLTNYS